MVNQVNAEQTPKPVVTAKMPRPRPRHDVAKRLFLLFAFCGSLYWMAFAGTPDLRLVVPVGGIAFLLGWAMLFFAVCWGERHGR